MLVVVPVVVSHPEVVAVSEVHQEVVVASVVLLAEEVVSKAEVVPVDSVVVVAQGAVLPVAAVGEATKCSETTRTKGEYVTKWAGAIMGLAYLELNRPPFIKAVRKGSLDVLMAPMRRVHMIDLQEKCKMTLYHLDHCVLI